MFMLKYLWALFWFILGFIFLLAMPVFTFCFLPLKTRLKIICPIWQQFGRLILVVGFFSKIFRDDRRSANSKSQIALYISNHQSYLDIPLILSCYQVPPIMKKEVLYIPIFGLLGYLSGAMIVSRANKNSRRKVLDQARDRMLYQKLSLQYYPEGTRSKNAQPKDYSEIKNALLKEAFVNKIPVIPTSIWGTRYQFEGNTDHRWGKPLGIIIHDAINPHHFQLEDDFARACWEQVKLGYQELQSKLG